MMSHAVTSEQNLMSLRVFIPLEGLALAAKTETNSEKAQCKPSAEILNIEVFIGDCIRNTQCMQQCQHFSHGGLMNEQAKMLLGIHDNVKVHFLHSAATC